ncbi:MAG TPA: HD domain-containing phosphohydrolase [Burkholderiales bacterium]|nr:HD domain-containing phosphohydrolase [Burkholderiales bacterium]
MSRRPLILVADDSEDIRNLFGIMLKSKYDVRFAVDSNEALAGADTEPLPDLILLDIEMPHLDGYEVCARLKANPALAHIPVIFVTGRTDPKDQAKGLLAGAVDYITKPVSAPITMLRVRTQLALVDQRRALEEQVQARTEELYDTRLELIRRLSRAMEYREGGLTNRVLRVGEYVELLSQAVGLKGKVVEILAQAAPLYDIGKMGVSEHILKKSDKLNDKEWEEVRKHPEIGAGIIGEHKDPLLEQARVMALTHHERWDGTGYPKKLKGEAIPVPGRIMAVADAFEAMTSTQRHSPPISALEAAKIISAESGKQFDPTVVAAFMKVVKEFDAVRGKYKDELAGIHDLDFAPAKKK